MSYVIDVTDAVTKAEDLKVSLGEGLDILDFLGPILEKETYNLICSVHERNLRVVIITLCF